MNIICDPTEHAYTLNGRPVPNVTSVLGDLLPCWQASDWHLQRGQAVHACAAMIGRKLDFRHDPEIEGQVMACKRFFAEMRPHVLHVETPVGSLEHGYAGTPDLICIINNRHVIVDYKAGVGPSLEYQLAAYAIAATETLGLDIHWGMGVVLRTDGQYQVAKGGMIDIGRRLSSSPRFGWLSLLAAHRIRRACGVA